MDYRVRLVTSTPHYRGLRWWFICPLVRNDRRPPRRVAKPVESISEAARAQLAFSTYSANQLCGRAGSLRGAQIVLKIGFDRSRLDEATVDRMLGHLRTLLEAMAERPMSQLGDLPILTPRERDQLLVEWNQTKAEYPDELCVHRIIRSTSGKDAR